MSDSVVRTIEEKGTIPLLDTCEKIARALEVSPCWLAFNIEAPIVKGDDLQCAGVGARLRQVRDARSLGLRALARAAGVNPTTISNIEDKGYMPTIAMAEKIARALKIDACWLSFGQGQAPDLTAAPA